jgi:predicted DNA-binding protein
MSAFPFFIYDLFLPIRADLGEASPHNTAPSAAADYTLRSTRGDFAMPTSVRLNPKLDAQVAAVAYKTGRTKSDVIRESVRAYCERVMNDKDFTLYDMLAPILERMTADPNAPADLSTNKKHMEGFAAEHAGANHR